MEKRIRLKNLVSQLREPEKYLTGGIGSLPGEPENILMFHRSPHRVIHTSLPGAETLYHKRYVLTVNLGGDGLVCINDKTFPVPETFAVLVYPFQSHYYLVDQSSFFWLVITFDWFDPNFNADLFFRSCQLDAALFAQLEQLLQLYLKGDLTADEELLFQRKLGSFLLELSLSGKRIDADDHTPAADSVLRLFEEINGFIIRNLSDPGLTIAGIAEKHYISESFLYNIFRSRAGCNPGEYIRNLRVNQAIKLLMQNKMQVSEIASACGFSSPAVFCRCFKHVTGLTPGKYISGSRSGRQII